MSRFPLDEESFARLGEASDRLHRNHHLLPLSAWILEDRERTVSVREAMKALGGVDRTRAAEALDRLVAIGAMVKLPRATNDKNEKRLYRGRDCHYWEALPGFLAEVEAGDRVQS
jgi:hypothetical protein